MARKQLLIILIFFLIIFPFTAQDFSDPLTFIGATLEDVFNSSSVPDEVFSFRGVIEKEDNVVFYYCEGFYLFLFANRVWQVRYDKNFADSISGIKLGFDRRDILELKGIPLIEDENTLVYKIKERNYSIRMKLYFTDEKLDDIYIYRADY